MTPQDLERRVRAVGCWPEGFRMKKSANGSPDYIVIGSRHAPKRDILAIILSELMAKMPGSYGMYHAPDGEPSWMIYCDAQECINYYATPLEAALACHEHSRGIKHG